MPAPTPLRAVVIDAEGSLFDVHSVALLARRWPGCSGHSLRDLRDVRDLPDFFPL